MLDHVRFPCQAGSNISENIVFPINPHAHDGRKNMLSVGYPIDKLFASSPQAQHRLRSLNVLVVEVHEQHKPGDILCNSVVAFLEAKEFSLKG